VEKLLKDKVTVSDDEIKAFVAENKETLATGGATEDEQKTQAADYLKSQKVSQEIATWVDGLKAAAKIERYLK
jgi:hypothetical protein